MGPNIPSVNCWKNMKRMKSTLVITFMCAKLHANFATDFIQFPPPLEITPSYCPNSTYSYSCESNLATWNSNNIAFAPTTSEYRKDLLFLFFPGTGSISTSFENGLLPAVASNQIFVLSLAYVGAAFPVSVQNTLCGTPSLNGNTDPVTCNSDFHESTVYGGHNSAIWNVTKEYAIQSRTISALKYLDDSYPDAGWSQFFVGNSINTNKIIVSGHSQGASHAGYFAAKSRVHQAVLLSGPEDCCGQGK